MTTAELDKILDRIAKLKSLEERPGTAEEAAAAAAMISKLMFRYNLTQAQIDTAERTETGTSFDIGHERYDIGANTGWKRSLLHVIGMYNFVRVIIHPGSDRVHMIGAEHNIAAVTALYESLVEALDRMVKPAYDTYHVAAILAHEPTTPARIWKASYRRGAVHGIDAAMKAEYDSDRQSSDASSALVLTTERALARAVRQFVGATTTSTSNVKHDDGAFGRGYEDGRSIGGTRKQLT